MATTPNITLDKPAVNIDNDWPTRLNADLDKVDAHDHAGPSTKGALVAMPVVNGRLTFVSATQIKFSPFQGNRLFIKKSGVWTATTIASAGITAANTSIFIDGVGSSNLAANTTYYVYLFDNAGTVTVDFSTTGHATDSTMGVEIKSGVDTRVLIGMVRTNASSQFQDDNALRGVLSYFNRRDIGLVNNFTANRTNANTVYTELNSEIRANFLTWGDETVLLVVNGLSSNNTAAGFTVTSIGIDGTNQENAFSGLTSPTGGQTFPVGISLVKSGLSEGFHFATVIGAVGANTGTWYGATYTADTTVRTICTLMARVRG